MKISNIHENGEQWNYCLHPLPSFNIIDVWLVLLWGLPGSSDGKESACNAGDLSSIWVGKIPGGEHGNPLQYSCLENPHGQRGLAGYSPWGRKEPASTEQLSTAQSYFINATFPSSQVKKFKANPRHIISPICQYMMLEIRTLSLT